MILRNLIKSKVSEGLSFKESKFLLVDFLMLLSVKRKSLKSKYSIYFNLNKIRIMIFRLPEYYFRKINASKINNNEKYIDSQNFEFANMKLNIEEKKLKFINNLFENNKISRLENKKKLIRYKVETSRKLSEEKTVLEYADVPKKDTKELLNVIFTKKSFKKFLDLSSIISGYKVKEKDLYFYIIKNKGENNNSDWHSDCFYSLVKGFIYLNEITIDDSPFQYLKGTSQIELLTDFYNLSSKYKKCSSPRISTKKQLEDFNNFEIKSHLGNLGSMMIANTSGIHRKGPDNSGKIRYMLGFEFRRLNLIQRSLRAIIKF